MATFDPAAAAAAYIATMSPAQQARAIAYTHGREWMLLWGWLVSLLVAWLVIRSGLLVKIRDGLQRSGPKPVLTTLCCALVYGALATVLSLPWDIYSSWWYEKSFGLTNQGLPGWLTESLINSVIGLVPLTIFYLVLYWAIRAARRTWWLWGGLAASVLFAIMFLAQPILIEPLFNKYTPAPAGPVRDAVVALGKETGTPTDKIFIYNGSKQSNRYTANVSGLFGSARVAMSDMMFKKNADISEVRGVVGHEMGHYVHQHSLWFIGAAFFLGSIAFWLTGLLFPLLRGVLGASAVKDLADPAGLPVLAAAIATVALLGTPVLRSAGRIAESDADSFSLAHAHEPDGLAKALVKTAEYRAPQPSRLEEVLFYDHPSVYNRVRKAMDWKAAHMAEAEQTEAQDAVIDKALSAGPAAQPAPAASTPGSTPSSTPASR